MVGGFPSWPPAGSVGLPSERPEGLRSRAGGRAAVVSAAGHGLPRRESPATVDSQVDPEQAGLAELGAHEGCRPRHASGGVHRSFKVHGVQSPSGVAARTGALLRRRQLPAKMAKDLDIFSRACVRDESGAKRLDLCWTEPRYLMVEVLDCGPIGWTSRYWMYGPGGVRGLAIADPLPRQMEQVQRFCQTGRSLADILGSECDPRGPQLSRCMFGFVVLWFMLADIVQAHPSVRGSCSSGG